MQMDNRFRDHTHTAYSLRSRNNSPSNTLYTHFLILQPLQMWMSLLDTKPAFVNLLRTRSPKDRDKPYLWGRSSWVCGFQLLKCRCIQPHICLRYGPQYRIQIQDTLYNFQLYQSQSFRRLSRNRWGKVIRKDRWYFLRRSDRKRIESFLRHSCTHNPCHNCRISLFLSKVVLCHHDKATDLLSRLGRICWQDKHCLAHRL